MGHISYKSHINVVNPFPPYCVRGACALLVVPLLLLLPPHSQLLCMIQGGEDS